jgi:hypothetical protein
MERRPYNPFEDLKDFKDLKSLSHYIVESIKVKEVKVVLPANFDKKLIHDPTTLVPVGLILVGNASFEYIRFKAAYILENVKVGIEKINQDTTMSLGDKYTEFWEIRRELLLDYQYYDSMNPIRYMSAYTWRISYTEFPDGKPVESVEDYPNSKIELNQGHWNEVENNFHIRRDLLSEILFLINTKMQELEQKLSGIKYSWITNDHEPYEIYELILALLESKRIDFGNGNQETFVHDFLQFFQMSDERFSYYRGKVLDRRQRSKFLPFLEKSLSNYPRGKGKE